MNRFLVILIATGLSGWAGMTQAVPCTATEAAQVTTISGCETGSVNNDFLNPLQVNIDTMFGFDDWLFAQKDDDVDGVNQTDIDIGFNLLGDAVSGTWSINDIWSVFDNVMIVIKGGTGGTTQPNYVGFLISSGFTSGSYATPFFNPANNNPKNISHISIYVRGGGGTVVSEPGTLAILGLGLAMFSLGLRRRTR